MSLDVVTIKNISKQIRGVSYSPSDVNSKASDNHVKLLRANNITENGINLHDVVFVNKKCVAEHQILREGDILIVASSGSKKIVGRAILIESDINCAFGAFCKVIRPTSKVNYRYLSYFFRSSDYRQRISHLSAGANINNLKNDDLDSLQIPLPPLPIQKRIAEILDAADALKRKDQELLKKYDELAQAIFIDMFGDPVKNEKGWEVRNIGKLGKISTGNTPSRAVEANYDNKYIEWIKTDNIEENSMYVSNSIEYLSEIGLNKGRTTPAGSLLIACIAGSVESIGRAALTNREVSFNQQINAIEPNENVKSLFLYFLFKYSRKHIQNHASNGMKRMLSKGEFEKIKMIVPKIHDQIEFERKIGQLILQKEKMKNTFLNTKNLFNSLIQKAFKGELVV